MEETSCNKDSQVSKRSLLNNIFYILWPLTYTAGNFKFQPSLIVEISISILCMRRQLWGMSWYQQNWVSLFWNHLIGHLLWLLLYRCVQKWQQELASVVNICMVTVIDAISYLAETLSGLAQRDEVPWNINPHQSKTAFWYYFGDGVCSVLCLAHTYSLLT